MRLSRKILLQLFMQHLWIHSLLTQSLLHEKTIKHNSRSLLNNLSEAKKTESNRFIRNLDDEYAKPRIKYETYKALVGETVRLECPQPNPTWFFRRTSNTENLKTNNNNNKEDLIVTRHGIINADYKYKIMCHISLKHKVIIINNIDFEEEGLYTCLYTMPIEQSKSIASLANTNYMVEDELTDVLNTVQYRHVFNVTVYTLISGLSMNLKQMRPLTTVLPPMSRFNKKFELKESSLELMDNSITVRENEEFFINCVVDSSKPAADIKFSMSRNVGASTEDNKISRNFNSTEKFFRSASSIISTDMNIIRNSDRTFKTVHNTRLKVTQDDHGKVITCKAENGYSNQKWENKKLLNVLYAPVCQDSAYFTYYAGINQTIDVDCRVLSANPSKITFEWNFDMINYRPNRMNRLENDFSNFNLAYLKNQQLPQLSPIETSSSSVESLVMLDKDETNVKTNDAFKSSFKFRPTSLNDFGQVKCKITNEIGSTECTYELKLGGIPNPPTDCTHVLKNTSAIISCQVGFHQGDPDIYCYLLRKSDNGVYKEHTRNRESCSFIVNEVNVNKLNEFWIYSSNRHGHNKDNGVYLTIGQALKSEEPTDSKTYMIIAGCLSGFIFFLLSCCFCLKLRKGMSDDSDSIFEGDSYQSKSDVNNQNIKKTIPNTYPPKGYKGIKNYQNEKNTNEMLSQIKDPSKYIKLEFNDSMIDVAEDSYKNTYYDKMKENEFQKESLLKTAHEYASLKNTNEERELIGKWNIFNENNSNNSKPKIKPKNFTSKVIKVNSVNGNVNGVGSLVRKTTIYSTSFKQQKPTKPQELKLNPLSVNEHDSPNSDESNKSLLESTPIFTNNPISNITEQTNCNDETNHSGLLTTVASTVNKTNSSSTSSLNDTKMITFGQSTNTIKRNNKTNQSISTLNTSTTHTAITTTTSASGSTTSPTTCSSNNESSPSNNSPVENSNKLIVSDQSFNVNTYSLCNKRSTALSTFKSSDKASDSTENINEFFGENFRPSPRRFIDTSKQTVGNFPVNNIENKFNTCKISPQSITSESKFLNKLCEDIEVSLNVDCECADDYSMNEFSGDYSFDYDIKSPITLNTKRTPKPTLNINNVNTSNNNSNKVLNSNKNKPNDNHVNSNTPLNRVKINGSNHVIESEKYTDLTNLRRNFERNLKQQLRSNSNGPNPNRVATKPASNQMGVLV